MPGPGFEIYDDPSYLDPVPTTALHNFLVGACGTRDNIQCLMEANEQHLEKVIAILDHDRWRLERIQDTIRVIERVLTTRQKMPEGRDSNPIAISVIDESIDTSAQPVDSPELRMLGYIHLLANSPEIGPQMRVHLSGPFHAELRANFDFQLDGALALTASTPLLKAWHHSVCDEGILRPDVIEEELSARDKKRLQRAREMRDAMEKELMRRRMQDELNEMAANTEGIPWV
jgi:hypothetical protein